MREDFENKKINENAKFKEELKKLIGSDEYFYNAFLEYDQKLNWNYEDETLVTNKIKNLLEGIDESLESEKFREEKYHTLWLWYHHASQYAFFEKGDREKAREFIKEALKYHEPLNHPNQMTEFLSYIYEGNFSQAKNHLSKMSGVELESAKAILNGIEKYEKRN